MEWLKTTFGIGPATPVVTANERAIAAQSTSARLESFLRAKLENIDQEIQGLNTTLMRLSPTSPERTLTFVKIRNKQKERKTIEQQLLLITHSQTTLSTTQSQVDLLHNLHTTNLATTQLLQEQQTHINGPPEQIFAEIQTTSMQTNAMMQMFDTYSAGISDAMIAELEATNETTTTTSDPMEAQIARYQRELAVNNLPPLPASAITAAAAPPTTAAATTTTTTGSYDWDAILQGTDGKH